MFKDYLLGRQAIYEFLFAACYYVPEVGFIKQIEAFEKIFAEFTGEDCSKDLTEGAKLLSEYVKENAHKQEDERALDLNISFTKLFISAEGVQSLETKWLDKEKDRQDIILPITNYFADYNVQKPTKINLPIDSFQMQLFFLYKIAETTALSAEDENKCAELFNTHKKFMDEHLFKWLGMYKDEYIEKCGTSKVNKFYEALILLICGFLVFDYNNINAIIEEQ